MSNGDFVKHFRELKVYSLARDIANSIYEMSKAFPSEERYGLTSQIRRSSRSVCANLAEAWRRRRYRAAFIAKLNDCESECSETQVWLEFAKDCGYMDKETFENLDEKCEQVIGMLVNMINHSDKWVIRTLRK